MTTLWLNEETGEMEPAKIASVGRWEGHLISCDGPRCPVEPDGVHVLKEDNYYGHRTAEVTCRHRTCNMFCPDSLNIHGWIPSHIRETDFSWLWEGMSNEGSAV